MGATAVVSATPRSSSPTRHPRPTPARGTRSSTSAASVTLATVARTAHFRSALLARMSFSATVTARAATALAVVSATTAPASASASPATRAKLSLVKPSDSTVTVDATPKQSTPVVLEYAVDLFVGHLASMYVM